MKNEIYTVKVVPVNGNKVFRRIEISGRSTLDTLSNTILNAYDFSRDHLYFFSMNKRVDPDACYYHPMAECGINAEHIRLETLKLKVGMEFYYLYDFGDEWLFAITVEKVETSDIALLPQVTDGVGTLVQYPDYDDDYDDEDYEDDLTIEVMYLATDIVEQRLKVLPAYLQLLWKRIVTRDLGGADSEIMQGISDLETAGVLEYEEDPHHLAIKVYSVRQDPGKLKCLKYLSRRIKAEQVIETLVQFYGVIEKQELERMALGYETITKSQNVSVQTTITLLAEWRGWNLFNDDIGTSYVSMFCRGIAEEILKARDKYPTKFYREFSEEEKRHAEAGLFGAIVRCYSALFQHLMFKNYWHPEDAEQFLEQAVKCVAMGYSETDYLEWARTAIREAGERLTKTTEKELKKFRKAFPSAALKGYTWGEYETIVCDGARQLSMFEEDSPFIIR